MSAVRTMTHTHTRTGTDLCERCGCPADWHRLDDSAHQEEWSLSDPEAPDPPFRCLGYDCEAPGPPVENGCDCPDFVPPPGWEEKFEALTC